MPPLTPTSPRLRFGAFELDSASGQLRKNSTLIKLPPQPFRLLQLLTERAGTVVTREEIRNALWTEATFVDFEHGINFSINQIRGALADDADKPRYIETLPRRGYRFIAPVEYLNGNTPVPCNNEPVEKRSTIDTATFPFPPIFVNPTAAPAATLQDAAAPGIAKYRQTRKWKWWLPLAAIAVLSLLAAVLFYRLIFPAPPHIVRIEQLTQSGRVDKWERMTSDGSRLFFLEREGDHWDSMEISTTGGESQSFHPPFPNTKILAISPDGSQFLVAPFTSLNGDMPLWITPVIGGAPRRIGELTANDATFSPDGTQIALAKSDGIFLADLTGSNLRQVASLPGEHWYIAWSPDGKLLRFAQQIPNSGVSTLWEVTAQGRNLHRLFSPAPEMRNTCCGRWSADGAYFFFTSYQDGTSDLWALKEPPHGLAWLRHKPARLSSGPVSYMDLLPGNDGHSAFAHGGVELLDVYIVDPKTSQAKEFLPGRQAMDVGFSPDGQWLFYVNRDALWRSRPDGSERMQLAANSPSLFINTPRWRPDSKFLLFFEQATDGNNQMYVVSTDGGSRRPILEANHYHDRPDWSPDGQSIVFTIADEPRPGQISENGIYVFDLQNGHTASIPDSADLIQARWSPDGRYLAAVSLDSTNIKLYDFSQKRWSEIARGNWMTLPVWSPDSKFVYYQDFHKPGQPLFRYHLQGSSTERVFSFEGLLKTVSVRCTFLGLATDGSYIVRNSGRGGNLYKLQLDLP